MNGSNLVDVEEQEMELNGGQGNYLAPLQQNSERVEGMSKKEHMLLEM